MTMEAKTLTTTMTTEIHIPKGYELVIKIGGKVQTFESWHVTKVDPVGENLQVVIVLQPKEENLAPIRRCD